MSIATRLTTADDLLRMPGDGYRYELGDGDLRKITPAGFEHGFVIAEVLWALVEPRKRKQSWRHYRC